MLRWLGVGFHVAVLFLYLSSLRFKTDALGSVSADGLEKCSFCSKSVQTKI